MKVEKYYPQALIDEAMLAEKILESEKAWIERILKQNHEYELSKINKDEVA